MSDANKRQRELARAKAVRDLIVAADELLDAAHDSTDIDNKGRTVHMVGSYEVSMLADAVANLREVERERDRWEEIAEAHRLHGNRMQVERDEAVRLLRKGFECSEPDSGDQMDFADEAHEFLERLGRIDGEPEA